MNETCELAVTDDRPDDNPASPGPAAGRPHATGPGEPPGPGAPLEWLEERICELAAHLAAGTCRFLQLIAEFDARRGWACWDLPSCAAWLAWKCQVAPGTAREQVRVARALTDLPVITGEFAAGRMSYAKVRALTRIATTATEAGLAEITGPMTAAQCERFAAAHRKASDDADLAARAARRVRVHVAEDGSVAITARLPAADGAVVLQALRAAAGDCEHPHGRHPDPGQDARPSDDAMPGAGDGLAETHAEDTAAAGPQDGAGVGPDGAGVGADGAAGDGATGPEDGAGVGADGGMCRASLADALVAMAGAYLSGKITAAGNPDIYQVIVHVGPEALQDEPGPGQSTAGRGVSAETPRNAPADASPADTSAAGRAAGHPARPARCHLDDGPALSPAAARAIACHATVSWMLHDHDGTLLDAGRRHRTPPPALRRAVRERDNSCCQFPGCNSRRTDIHHIIPWAKGGKTRLTGLILLCEAHHVIVHAARYQITPAPGGFAFTRPDGQPLPSSPELPESDGDLTRCHDADITADTIIPAGLADKLDLDLAIWACFVNARIDAQRASQDQHEHDLAA